MKKVEKGFKPIERHCVECGKKFLAKQWNSERCLACRKERLHTQSLARSRKHAYLEDKLNGRKCSNSGTDSEVNRCLYCGSKIGADSFFCKRCRDEGFDNVYIMTHKSNGWEKRMAKHADTKGRVKFGWRGQRVSGCMIAANSSKYSVAI